MDFPRLGVPYGAPSAVRPLSGTDECGMCACGRTPPPPEKVWYWGPGWMKPPQANPPVGLQFSEVVCDSPQCRLPKAVDVCQAGRGAREILSYPLESLIRDFIFILSSC